MKKLIIVVLLITIYRYNILPVEYIFNNYRINYDSNTEKDIKFIIDEFDSYEKLYSSLLSYKPHDILNVFVYDKIDEYMRDLNIPYWVGGYYSKKNIFLQPLGILFKKNILKKVLFIEYSHYFFDCYTNDIMPLWFNEALSYYYYNLMLNDNKLMSDNDIFEKCDDFINLNKNIRNRKLLQKFYNTSVLLCYYINGINNQLIIDLLSEMSNGNDFYKSFKKITGKDFKIFYENDFVKFKK